MDRLTSREFDAELHCEETPGGILVSIRLLTHGDRSVTLRARLDTRAADCVFDDSYADILGLTDSQIQREYRTVTGSFKTRGHEITLETLGLEWTAMVFFHAMGNPSHAFVGRRGWLDGSDWGSCITNSGYCSGSRASKIPTHLSATHREKVPTSAGIPQRPPDTTAGRVRIW